MNKTHERWKDNQNHGLNVKELNTKHSKCINCVLRPGKKIGKDRTHVLKTSNFGTMTLRINCDYWF